VRCNVVCPGPVRTKMLEHNFEPMTKVLNTDMDGVFERMRNHVPLRMIANPSDIAGLFVFLASEDSRFMTGSTILIDGGVHVVDAFASSVMQYGSTWG